MTIQPINPEEERVAEIISDTLNELLERGNCEGHNRVINVDLKRQTVTIEFDYHVVGGEIYLAPF